MKGVQPTEPVDGVALVRDPAANRRSLAIGIALLALIVVIAALTMRVFVPVTRYSPGPTYDVLGERSNGEPIVEVQGHETYPTEGQLRMLTVNTTGPQAKLSLFEVMSAWFNSDFDLYPRKAIFPEPQTNEESRQESAREMVTSQDVAVAAALHALDIATESAPMVVQVITGGASQDILKVRDVLRSVNGVATPTLETLYAELAKLSPGDVVRIGIEREREPRTVDITTVAAADDPDRAVIGIFPAVGYVFPFDVNVTVDQGIGGPSAGMIFALSIYDTLTPGALTGGETIAGTGTISATGEVGPISGVRQKIAGAERDGASLFLVPVTNCDEAVEAETDLRVVPVATLDEAIGVIETYAADADAALPSCSP